MQTIGILGGTFNPVHIGHIRPAVEVFEAIKPDRIDLIPCASPPHKEGDNLLPFALRAEMVTAAAAPFPFLHVSKMENERPGPSYTIDTLEEYRKIYPDSKLFFILGAGDLATLPTWHRGMEITNLADLVVLPRSGKDAGTFHAIVSEYWPGAELLKTKAPLAAKYGLPTGHTIHFLPQPRLDISATLVRERWLAGRNVTYLVPRAVHEIMQRERETITACWKNS
ncbi:nicotinate-nucleotide adenylyltransferase [Desulfovibrio subterraneus]|uniref:nicotinate-nucleotide adenylyltransferase n=1 Tax=Desulfovibrio subterraneus TaxID=2718620 RepID=UPI0022B898EE|nr:nicotinate-nucleotide adenylyltransferase [Desulfovibrio subterraneus]WBF67805.1 nicotinate-nucleotide adenylyltransferase [Desulfovibrio subterraneus]